MDENAKTIYSFKITSYFKKVQSKNTKITHILNNLGITFEKLL